MGLYLWSLAMLKKLKSAIAETIHENWVVLATGPALHICKLSDQCNDVDSVCDVFNNKANGEFIALAHNAMPDLLEAANLLKQAHASLLDEVDEYWASPICSEIKHTLAKLGADESITSEQESPKFDWHRKGLWVVVKSNGEVLSNTLADTPYSARAEFIRTEGTIWSNATKKGFVVVELVVAGILK